VAKTRRQISLVVMFRPRRLRLSPWPFWPMCRLRMSVTPAPCGPPASALVEAVVPLRSAVVRIWLTVFRRAF